MPRRRTEQADGDRRSTAVFRVALLFVRDNP
jgi:hypothetical protein